MKPTPCHCLIFGFAFCLSAILTGCLGDTDQGTAGIRVPAAEPMPADQALPIVAPGLRTVLIVSDDPADLHAPNTRYVFPYVGGQLHLKRHLDWIAQTNLPVLPASAYAASQASQPFDVRIWVGLQPEVRKALGKDLESLDEDGFIIRADGADVYIAGQTAWATEYAVYELLEKFACCRFYAPGPDVWVPADQWEPGLFSIVPRAPAVAIPRTLSLREEPDYKTRYMRHMPSAAFRSRRRDNYSHNLLNAFIPVSVQTNRNPEVYAMWTRAHLDWFPEINGVRTPPPRGQFYNFQPCVGNPEVLTVLAREAREAFTQQGLSCFSVGMNDSDRYCKCSRCAALVPPAWQGRLTDAQTNAYVFFAFYNRLANTLAPEFPRHRLGCLAYAQLSTLPEGLITLHPMVVPYLTRDSAQLFDAREVLEFKDTVNKWSRLAKHMGIYEYTYGGGFFIPRLYNRYLLANIKNRYGVGVDGFYAEDYPNWGLDGIKYWLIMKTLWDVDADPGRLQAQYCSDLYGPAAGTMSAYYDDLEETWCTQESRGVTSDRSNYRWMNDVRQFGIFTPDRCERAAALLDRAEREIVSAAMAQTGTAERAYADQALQRMRFHKSAFEVTRALCTLYATGRDLEAMATNRAPFAYAAALEKFAAASRLPTVEEIFAQITTFRAATPPAFNRFNGGGDSDLAGFTYHYGRHPGFALALRRMTGELMDAVLKQRPDNRQAIRQAMARELRSRLGGDAAARWNDAASRLATMMADTGALIVPTLAAVPVMDGAIGAQEWGEPAFEGHFFNACTLDPARDRTTIWTGRRDGRLFFAFRCEQATNTIACAVTGVRTDTRLPFRMIDDDALAINMLHPQSPLRSLRFNAAGAWSDDVADPAKPQPYTVKTRLTAAGWEAEVAFDEKDSPYDEKAVATLPLPFCVSRYAHTADAGKPRASTLVPIAPMGGTIGSGNHTDLMTIIWGPRLVYTTGLPKP